jgi:hypothetical protein
LKLLWTQSTEAALAGLSLARESGWSLAWDSARWLHLFNRSGERQAQVQLPAAVAQAVCADDGLSFSVVQGSGQIGLLARDLMPRWQRHLEHPGLAVALSALGELLAVSDLAGDVHLFDSTGRELWKVTLPRPCEYLAFIPERPLLIGCADFGLVACLNLSGEIVWRDGLVAQVGSLSIAAAGDPIALACYGDGLWCYDPNGRKRQRADLAPCSLAALSYTGDAILTVGLEATVRLLDRHGTSLDSMALDSAILRLALAPLADTVWVGLGEGKVIALGVETPGR